MGRFEKTNHPSIFKYVGKKKVSFIIHYQTNHKLYSESFSSIKKAMSALEDRREKARSGEIEPTPERKRPPSGTSSKGMLPSSNQTITTTGLRSILCFILRRTQRKEKPARAILFGTSTT
jgi:hypothetical protein